MNDDPCCPASIAPAPKGLAMTVTIYTTPACQQCNMTKRWLATHGVTFGTVDITTSPEAEALIKGLGYTAAPVVIAGAESWSGFRPDLLAALVDAA